MGQILNTLAELISSSKNTLYKSPKASRIQSVDFSPVNDAMASFDLSRDLIDNVG
jgi:hypothetical protein